MAQHDQLYQRAQYYDIALRRDVRPEVDFVQEVYRRHAGAEATSVLEIGCGPGYHAREFARRGLRSVGLDYSAPMLQLAQEQAAEEGASVEWLVADMRDFLLEQPVDMAVVYFDGIDALHENADLVRHLRVVADNLTSNGLYIIDCTHPRECSYRHYGDYHYSGERDGTKVDIYWATNEPVIDPVTGVAEVGLEVHIQQNGHTEIIKDVAHERCFTPQEINLLTELSDVFQIVAWYGDYDVNQPLDNTPHSHRMIAVLQKHSE
jgi:SAM-dependent methyltransferase